MAITPGLDRKAHWQAIYDAIVAAQAAAGLGGIPVVHVFSGDDAPNVSSVDPPFIEYRQDVERNLGTYGDGTAKVLRSNWVIVSRAEDLEDCLAYSSAIVSYLVDADITTTDGYTTTNLEILGTMTLYERDAGLYADHIRFAWERSR